MRALELGNWIGLLFLVFGVGFGLPILLHSDTMGAKKVQVEKPCDPCVDVRCPLTIVCPICAICPAEKIIEREIQIPCPECRCLCKTSGAWATNDTWWYDKYRPENNGTWNETP